MPTASTTIVDGNPYLRWFQKLSLYFMPSLARNASSLTMRLAAEPTCTRQKYSLRFTPVQDVGFVERPPYQVLEAFQISIFREYRWSDNSKSRNHYKRKSVDTRGGSNQKDMAIADQSRL